MKEFEGLKVPDNTMYKRIDCEGIVCGKLSCCDCILSSKNKVKHAKYILSHHTPITENILPFGMLSEEKQEELRKAEVINNGKSSIQFFNGEYFDDFIGLNSECSWFTNTVYRLDPQWKPKKMRQMSLQEIWDKRKEWEFSLYYNNLPMKETFIIDSKTSSFNEEIELIYLKDTISHMTKMIDKVDGFIKYRPIGSSEEFKPLPFAKQSLKSMWRGLLA